MLYIECVFFCVRPLYSDPIWYYAIFFYVQAIRSAFFNNRRDQSDCCDFAVTNRAMKLDGAHLFTVVQLNAECEFCGKACVYSVCSVFVRFSNVYKNCMRYDSFL